MTLYDELEVSPRATTETIKAAHRSLSKRYHPDLNPGDEEASARIRRINEAYTVLSDEIRRRDYDRQIGIGSSPDVSKPPPPPSSHAAPSGRASHPHHTSGFPGPAYPQQGHPSAAPSGPFASQAPTPQESMKPAPPRRRHSKRFTIAMAILSILAVLMAYSTLRAHRKQARALDQQSARISAMANPELSLDDQITIKRACAKFHSKGDPHGEHQCREAQLAIASSTPRPALEGVPLNVLMAIRTQCDSFQASGDLAGHRDCMRKKLADPKALQAAASSSAVPD